MGIFLFFYLFFFFFFFFEKKNTSVSEFTFFLSEFTLHKGLALILFIMAKIYKLIKKNACE